MNFIRGLVIIAFLFVVALDIFHSGDNVNVTTPTNHNVAIERNVLDLLPIHH